MKNPPNTPIALRALAVRLLVCACIFAPGCATTTSPLAQPAGESSRRWLAGEHHIHSRYSVGLDRTTVPPTSVVGGAGGEPYPIAMNAVMAKYYGLSWMVSTDHGGPNHAKVNFDKAYPELVHSRQVVPEVIQFYGMELNPPAADHASVIVPHSHQERQVLYDIEFGYDKNETFPRDPSRDTEAKMIEALQFMERLSPQPVVIANHPSRSATALGVYGQDRPDELRNWNDAAPNVAVGMEGAQGIRLPRSTRMAPTGRPGCAAATGSIRRWAVMIR